MNKRGLEARDNWIAARIDELLSCDKWRAETLEDWAHGESDLVYGGYAIQKAEKQAIREHAAIMADLEDERINQHRGHYEF